MIDPNYIILYVDNPLESSDFYAALLGRPAIESSPLFALFVLDSGVKFGLWANHSVAPSPTVAGGGAEVAISVQGNEQVESLHHDWKDRGLPILQAPTQMDFGYTFVAADPDGHRLRIFAPSMP